MDHFSSLIGSRIFNSVWFYTLTFIVNYWVQDTIHCTVLFCNRFFSQFHSHPTGRENVPPASLSEEWESLLSRNHLEMSSCVWLVHVFYTEVSCRPWSSHYGQVHGICWMAEAREDPHLALRIGSASPKVHGPTRVTVGMEWNWKWFFVFYKGEWRKRYLVESWLYLYLLLGQVSHLTSLINSVRIWIEDKSPSFPSSNEHIQCPYLGF